MSDTQWCDRCKQWTAPEVASARYIAGVVAANYYACPFCGWPTYEEKHAPPVDDWILDWQVPPE